MIAGRAVSALRLWSSAVSPPLQAPAPQPVVTFVFPAGAQQGKTIEATINGKLFKDMDLAKEMLKRGKLHIFSLPTRAPRPAEPAAVMRPAVPAPTTTML